MPRIDGADVDDSGDGRGDGGGGSGGCVLLHREWWKFLGCLSLSAIDKRPASYKRRSHLKIKDATVNSVNGYSLSTSKSACFFCRHLIKSNHFYSACVRRYAEDAPDETWPRVQIKDIGQDNRTDDGRVDKGPQGIKSVSESGFRI